MWLTELLGTWKIYIIISFAFLIYGGSTYLSVANGLLKISGMVIYDYFDRTDEYTHIMWTSMEIKN